MKKTTYCFVVFLFASWMMAGFVVAMTENLTAGEWQKISRQRKIYFVLGSMEAQQKEGVVFHHTMDQYIAQMDKCTAGMRPSTRMSRVFLEITKTDRKKVGQ